jgi:hypothetical protein
MNPTTSGTGSIAGSDGNPMSNPAVSDKVEQAAQRGHQAVDKVADKTLSQLDRLSGSAHRAVNSAADAAASATQWASTLPDQARQAQVRLTEAACESIRARPLAAIAGALFVGYVFARMSGRRSGAADYD